MNAVIDGITTPWSGCITGELASKANSRRVATSRRTGKMIFIKSGKANTWVEAAQRQLMTQRIKPLIDDPVRFDLQIFYASRRPDLDPALFFDAIQGFLIKNDRQVEDYRVRRRFGRVHPRVEWSMWLL